MLPGLSSETPRPVSDVPSKPITFALSYSKDDPLNPFTASSRVNLDLVPLLYEGLTATDAGLVPQMALAASVALDDPLHPAATLRDIRFSDGSAVTAADVAASFSKAKACAHYAPLLQNVQSARADGDRKVVFTLSNKDPHVLSCLTFPVVKASTAGDKVPVGAGAYAFRDGEVPSLTLNAGRQANGALTTIVLRDITDADAMLHGLESGSISYYFNDLSSGEIPRTSTASVDVPLSQLVFIGINASRAPLKNAAVRAALSAATDRTALAENAYVRRAQAAVSPFPSAWSPAAELKGFQTGENIAGAVAELEKAGYNTGSGNSAANTQKLTLELLVAKGNSFRDAAAQLLKEQWAKAGVTLTVTSLSFSEYEKRLSNKNFDLYLGEIRLSADMSLRPLLTKGGKASYGVQTDGSSSAAYAAYLNGDKTMQEFVDAFVQDVPLIPLCWRKGIAAYHRSLSGVTPTALNIYYGIGNWTLSQPGADVPGAA